MKALKIGLASHEKLRERVLAIAKGEFKPTLGLGSENLVQFDALVA